MPQVRAHPLPEDLLIRTAIVLAAAAACAWARPAAATAQGEATAPLGPVEVILDASGSMRGRLGESERMSVAREFLRALRAGLSDGSEPAAVGLRVYGAGSHRRQRDCTDTQLLVSPTAPPDRFEEALGEVAPIGVSPLAVALGEAAADTAQVYVLVGDGGDNCQGDPCQLWLETTARRTGPRPRLHVVAIDPEPEDVDRLRCLSRSSSGAFLTIGAPDEARPAGERLALILRNQGIVDVRLSVGEETFSAPVRLVRPLTGEVVAAFVSRASRRVPAGMYTAVLETAPPVTIERVMVLPGERVLIERSDYGRLLVNLHRPGDTEVRAAVSVRSADGGPELRFAQTGQPIVLREGSYDLHVELDDSLAIREGVAVVPGRTTRVALGGTAPGTLSVEAPEFASPPPTRAFLYREGRIDTLAVGQPAPLSPGVYRLVVQTLPPYVAENVRVESEEETVVTLPETGVLGVRLNGPEGPLRGVRVDVREPLTGEVYGTIQSGERRLVMPGAYRLEVRSAPLMAIDDVRVGPGEERVVERGNLSAVTLAEPALERVRLEVWSETGARRLAEAYGTQPVVAARPGAYIARVSRGGELVWQGRIVVAPGKTARIDWPGP